MRKYITTGLLIFFTLSVFSQSTHTTATPTAADYLQKSGRQKTTAWVLTTAGTTGLLVTLIADAGQAVGGAFVTIASVGYVEPEYKSYTAYYLISTAAIAGGVVYFIRAGKNKQRARALQTTLKMETAPRLQSNGIGQQTYPSLSLSVRL